MRVIRSSINLVDLKSKNFASRVFRWKTWNVICMHLIYSKDPKSLYSSEINETMTLYVYLDSDI